MASSQEDGMNLQRAMVAGLVAGAVLFVVGFLEFLAFRSTYESPEIQAITRELPMWFWTIWSFGWGIALGLAYGAISGVLSGGTAAKAAKFAGIAWLFLLATVVGHNVWFLVPGSFLWWGLIATYIYHFIAGLVLASLYKEGTPEAQLAMP